jgi:hypothetical protein
MSLKSFADSFVVVDGLFTRFRQQSQARHVTAKFGLPELSGCIPLIQPIIDESSTRH